MKRRQVLATLPMVVVVGCMDLDPWVDSADGEADETSQEDDYEEDTPTPYEVDDDDIREQLDSTEVREHVHERVNEARLDHDLDALSSDEDLRAVALEYSRTMAEASAVAHDIDGSSVRDRLDEADCESGSENLAQSWEHQRIETTEGSILTNTPADLAEQLVVDWLDSASHRENILESAWSRTGVGIEIGDVGYVWATQLFCD